MVNYEIKTRRKREEETHEKVENGRCGNASLPAA